MTEQAKTWQGSFTAEQMIRPRSRWERLWRWLRRQPKLIQPAGTQPLVFETAATDGTKVRYYMPAARFHGDEDR
jgi:hypothetical protein